MRKKSLTLLEDLKCRYPEDAWQTQNGTTSLQTLQHRWGLCSCWMIFDLLDKATWPEIRSVNLLKTWHDDIMKYCWWFRNPAIISWGNGSLFHTLYGWFYKSNRWLHPWDVFNHQQYGFRMFGGSPSVKVRFFVTFRCWIFLLGFLMLEKTDSRKDNGSWSLHCFERIPGETLVWYLLGNWLVNYDAEYKNVWYLIEY